MSASPAVRVALALALSALLSACRSNPAPPRDGAERAPDAATEQRLQAHVRMLAGELAPRCGATPQTHEKLETAARYLQSNLELLLRGVSDRSMVVQRYEEGARLYSNVAFEFTVEGAQEIVVVGAHYDSFCGAGEPYTPGADDNASGTAMLLELARRFDERRRAAATPWSRALRFVAFTNEEPPYFQTGSMGSLVYAHQAQRRGDRIAAMLSLETLGYYSDEPGSQTYPAGIERFLDLPQRGDFLAFVGNLDSRALMVEAVDAFRRGTTLPAEGLAAPFIPQIGWSDNWSFWQVGFPAVMVTDTAPQRNPNYHLASDTADTLDYRRMAMAADGLTEVVATLVGDAGSQVGLEPK